MWAASRSLAVLNRVASAGLVRCDVLGCMTISLADARAARDRAAVDDAVDDGASAETAILKVLRGNPNPTEVAALVVALAHIRARNAAEDGLDNVVHLPPVASWDRPRPVVYRSPSSWMRAA